MKYPFSILRFILFLFIQLFSMQSCQAQKRDIVIIETNKIMETIITKDFEKFDLDFFEKNKQVTGNVLKLESIRKMLENGTYIEMYGNNNKQYVETPKDSYFTYIKGYYSNGYIKSKGLGFNAEAFAKGTWYEFDELGNLVKEIDYDKNYKFTFEDILKFCEKENILVEKGSILQSTGFHTSIRREFVEASKKATWTIERLKPTDRPNIDKRETITIDGTTGQVLSRKESPYVNN